MHEMRSILIRKKTGIFFIVVFLLGILLRIYKLSAKDFWFDEAGKLLVENNLYICFEMLRPLFNIFLYLWLKIVPHNEFAIRVLPFIFGIASLPIIYLYGKEMFNREIALFCTFLLSVSPLHVWYSQELKAYTLTTFLTIAVAYYFYRFVKEEKFHLMIVLSFIMILLVYTTYLSFAILVIEALFLIIVKRGKLLKKWSIHPLIVFACFSPRLLHLLWRMRIVKESFWISEPTLESVWATFANFNLGYTGSNFLFQFSLYLTLPFLIFALFKVKREKEIQLNFLLLFVPLVSALIYSFLSTPIFITRQFVQFTPFYYLLISRGLYQIRWRMVRFLYIIALLIPTSFSLFYLYSNLMPSSYTYHIGIYPKKSFRKVVEYISKNSHSWDIIAHSNPSTTLPLQYYSKEKGLAHYYFILPSYHDPFWRRNIMEIGVPGFAQCIDLSTKVNLNHLEDDVKRVWLVSSSWARNWELGEHSQRVKEWMDTHAQRILEQWMEGILLTLYELEKKEES
ncbi:MAG TPA: glycosyltransferase family 39 protein [Candidatus Omnitrophica bacterium]|nr:glycosyltransferase family 39 protein [Candidatus Omnitrophota bacterium]